MNPTDSFFENIMDRITDGFVALDTNWCYTYMNKRAGQIFDRDPEQMIGKHIWTEFPEGVGKPFHKAYEKAMEQQTYIYLQEHYEPYDLWFENHIYPSPNGLSIVFRDISERKQLEEKLASSEKLFRTLASSAPVAVFKLDTNGQCTFMNEKGLQYLDMQFEDALGSGWINGIHPKDREVVMAAMREAIETGIDFSAELRCVDKKKKVTWVSSHIVRMFDNDKNLVGYDGMAIDITARKKAEYLLSESEEKFRTLADNCIPGIMMRLHGEIIYVNPAYCQITGFSETELMDLNLEQQLRLVHPDDRETEKERLLIARNNGILDYMKEVRLIKKNGETVWIKGMTKNLELKGISYQMGMALDITDQKLQNEALIKSNQRNAAFLEAMPDVIFVMTREGVFTDYNNPLATETFTPPETFLQKSIFEILPPDLANETMYNINLVFEKGESPIHQYQLAYPDGDQHFEARYAKINDNEVLVVVRDITRRKKGEEKIKQLNEDLERRVKERTAELEIANEHLQEINDLFVGNEITIYELKEEIKKLKNIQID